MKIVVSCDQGGAEVLSSYLINKIDNKKYRYFLKGPAIKVFQRAKLIPKNYKIKYIIPKNTNYAYFSMSWSDIFTEKVFLKCKKKNIKTEIVLDGWYNYRNRLGKTKKALLKNIPDILTITDKMAEKIVYKNNLNKFCKINKVKNYYYFYQKKKYNKIKEKNKKNNVLVLSVPFKNDKVKELAEITKKNINFYDYFIHDTAFLCKKLGLKAIIRPHPKERKHKLLYYKKVFGEKTVISSHGNILHDIIRSEFVLGFNSNALILASLLGKKSITYAKNKDANIFQWKDYGVYEYFNISLATNIKELEKKFNCL